jgi:ethylbenzene dioxygenase ferredoxin component
VPVFEVSELAVGQIKRVCVPGYPPIAIYNVGGSFYATADTCTHARASLSEGDLDGRHVVCPVHWAEFDVTTGRAMSFPASIPLVTYSVTVEGDTVILALPADR